MKAAVLILASIVWCGEARAYDVYDGCIAPGNPAHVWFVDAGPRGSTPDAAHGGLAVNGVMGTADGSPDHPFNSLAAVFHGGKYEGPAIPGYGRPLLSSAPYDHYPGTGVNGQRKDHDWNPAKPDPNRINPGDMVVVRKGAYGALNVGYYGVNTYNVDAAGATAFVQIVADDGVMVGPLAISAARGFVLDGLTVKSPGAMTAIVANITGGSAAAKTQDIILSGGQVESFDDLADVDQAYAAYKATNPTPVKSEQQFINANFKRGVFISGSTVAGDNASCIAVDGVRVHHVQSAFGIQGASKALISDNVIDHFTGDGVDLLTSFIRLSANRFSSPINDGSGIHPDTMQSQWSGAYTPSAYHDVVIDRNVEIERLDAANPYPQNITFAQVAAASGLVITNNLSQTSNCPGIALGPATQGALIANNTVVGNGVIPVSSCGAVQSGEVAGADNNTWTNNVTAGRFYQVCNHSVWQGNVQVPSRQGGKSFPGGLGWCDKATNTVRTTGSAGVYNGVTIVPTDKPDFAFVHYDPPQSGLSSLSDPDLHPVCGGPLANCAANVGALKPQ